MPAHAAGVERLLASYRTIPATASVRLAKQTSNLFRARVRNDAPGLDTSGLTGVISVDPDARTADVAGMCTYEDLVAATLPYGLSPLVVPQLKTITLGGAVTGLGIESASFRNGMPHESVLELDILTGTGEVLTASPEHHPDLYRAFPNSYGTLGYAVRLRIELETVQPFVALRHVRYHSLTDLVEAMNSIVETGSLDGIRVDYLDGVVFSADECYLSVGSRPRRGRTGQRLHRPGHLLPVDPARQRHHRTTGSPSTTTSGGGTPTGSGAPAAFGAQHPRLRRWWPRRYRRSSFYWKLLAYDQRFRIVDRIEKRHGRPPRERVVQDVEVPIERCVEFLDWFLSSVPIEPIWLCPVRPRDRWSLYPMRPGHTYVNLGFWSSVPGRCHRGRDEPADRAEGPRARRAQVAVLGRLLLPG